MTKPLRVLVVDDEPVSRAGVVALLRADPDLTVIGECGDGASAVAAIRRDEPDLVLLDIQMPEMDGFDVVRAIGADRMPPVVFVTAHDRYALDAFRVHALDYLLKPFDDEAFERAIRRAKELVRSADAARVNRHLAALLAERGDAAPGPDAWLSRIVVKNRGASTFLAVDDIDWIESADYCVRLHAKGRVHVVRETMQRLEARLDPRKFFRAHRSGIVNLDRIREVQPAFHGDLLLVLTTGAQVKLARTRRSALEEVLGQSL